MAGIRMILSVSFKQEVFVDSDSLQNNHHDITMVIGVVGLHYPGTIILCLLTTYESQTMSLLWAIIVLSILDSFP